MSSCDRISFVPGQSQPVLEFIVVGANSVGTRETVRIRESRALESVCAESQKKTAADVGQDMVCLCCKKLARNLAGESSAFDAGHGATVNKLFMKSARDFDRLHWG
jgi:hypothetical protein